MKLMFNLDFEIGRRTVSTGVGGSKDFPGESETD